MLYYSEFHGLSLKDVGTENVFVEFGPVTFENRILDLVDFSVDKVDFDHVNASLNVESVALNIVTFEVEAVVSVVLEIGNFDELEFEVKNVDLDVASLDGDTVYFGAVVL